MIILGTEIQERMIWNKKKDIEHGSPLSLHRDVLKEDSCCWFVQHTLHFQSDGHSPNASEPSSS